MEKFIKLIAAPTRDSIGPVNYINPNMIIGVTRSEDDSYTAIFTNKWMYKVIETPEQIFNKIQNL